VKRVCKRFDKPLIRDAARKLVVPQFEISAEPFRKNRVPGLVLPVHRLDDFRPVSISQGG
jgi:hypothetical protein